MALYTKKDFAGLCGVKTNYLAVLIKRGNIVLTGELIDESIDLNFSFLKKKREEVLSKDKDPAAPIEIKKAPQIKLPEVTDAEKWESVTFGKKSAGNLGTYELDKQLKFADLEKKEVDTRIALLKEEKLLGSSIPTDMVKSVFANLSKSFVSAFKDGADGFIIEISKQKNLTAVETAKIKGALIDIINQSSLKAVSESRKNLQSIINEYSNKKEVGEHE